jgi:iron complex outermembrane receptor protein
LAQASDVIGLNNANRRMGIAEIESHSLLDLWAETHCACAMELQLPWLNKSCILQALRPKVCHVILTSAAMKMLKRSVIATTVSNCLVFLWLAQDSAQSSESTYIDLDAEGPMTLQEVIVTARRRAENAQDVPIPLTAVEGSSLEEIGVVRLEDLNRLMPSLNVQFANPRQTSLAVRGLGNNPANDGLESSVGVYLDDVYLGRPGMASQDLDDIDQVSLLRGPQGTLYGKNTTAGVLTVTTRLPSFTPYALLETSLGNDGYYQLRGTVSGPIDESLAGRLSVSKTSRDGYLTDVTDDRRLNSTGRQGFRGQLLFRPNSALSVRIIGDYETENSNCCAQVLYSEGPNNGALYKARLSAANALETYDPTFSSVSINDFANVAVRQGGGSVESTLDLAGGYTLTSITAYRAWHFVPHYDADNTSVSAIIDAGQAVDDEQWSQEIRFLSPIGAPIDWVAGIYYFYQYQNNLFTTQYGPAASALFGSPAFFNDSQSNVHSYPKTNSYAAFAEDVWHATEVLSLTTGVRDTYEEKTSHIERDAPIGPAVNSALPSFSSGPLQVSNNNLSGLLTLDYKFVPSSHAYLTVSRGAKAGGIGEAVPSPGLPVSSLYVLPEKVTDYEIGLKSQSLNQRLVGNINFFWTNVTDYQATELEQPVPGVFQPTLSNIGSIRSRGIETEISSKMTGWLTIGLTASYNDAIYTSYANAPCSIESTVAGLVTCNLTGRPVVGAPKWIANPSIGVTHNLGSDLIGYAVAQDAWRSAIFGTPDDSQFARVKSYGLLDLRAGLRGHLGTSAWDFSLWATNALDKRYVVGGVSGASGPTFGAYWLVPGNPRFWGATIRLEF